ncbi:hypothetical protein L596_012432 [Steinernema carpocapsae]|uniref:Uncharacterized protein n=1 Tax=Steinernema carpocapsae TaxID=34508 RepID=A0A4U5NXW8_STECR|nr:hypothetical protein L596_012432 [Steinernema carpocapsae]
MLPDPLINRTKTGYERIEKSGDGWKLVDFNEEVDFILVNFEPLSPETWNVTLNHDSIWNDSTKFYEKWDFSFKWNRIDAKFLKFSEDVLYFGEQKMIDVVDMSVGNCMEWQRSLVNDKINPKVVDSVNGAIYNVEKNSEAERTLIGVHDGQKIFRRKCLASKQRKKHKSALTVATHELRFKSAENLYCYEVENCEVAYGPRAMVFDVLIEPKPCPTASSDASAGPVAENVTEVLQNVSSPVALQEDYSSTASAVLNTSISELTNNTIAATLNVSTKHLPTEQENIMAAKLSIVGDSLEPNDDAVAKAHTMQLIYILVVIFLAALIIATGVVNGSLFWQLVKTTREEAPSEESSTLRRNSNVEVGRTGAKPSTKKKK